MSNQKGEISLGAIGLVVGVATAVIGGWITQSYRTDAKIESLRIEQQGKIESLSAGISTLNINVALICQALKIKCRE